jgi:alpha-glucosidase
VYTTDQPELFDILHEMRAVVDAYPERVLIGEIYLPVERLVAYYGSDGRKGVHLPFNFQLLQTAWKAADINRIVAEYEALMEPHMWPNWVLGNHDRPRVASRVGSAQARVAAMMLLTFRGTPTMYYGDELGMEDVPLPREALRDGWAKNEPGIDVSRDPQRTPMQWNESQHAGFSTVEPWLPLSADRDVRNVETLRADHHSILTLYRRLIALRRGSAALSIGAKRLLRAPRDAIAFERTHANQCFVVVLNLGQEPCAVDLENRSGRIVLSTHLEREAEAVRGSLTLGGDEGLVVKIDL